MIDYGHSIPEEVVFGSSGALLGYLENNTAVQHNPIVQCCEYHS